MPGPTPDEAHASFEREIDLLESAERSGAPTQDERSGFFGLPQDEFVVALRSLRDEIEHRAYLAIVAATEALVQTDFRGRSRGRRSEPLVREARALARDEERRGPRIVLEDVLDAWSRLGGARRGPISEFRQLLDHRHWLAHGRYFTNRAGVPNDPDFAIARVRALVDEFIRLDPSFPRG